MLEIDIKTNNYEYIERCSKYRIESRLYLSFKISRSIITEEYIFVFDYNSFNQSYYIQSYIDSVIKDGDYDGRKDIQFNFYQLC
jgi:hypothetical protein